MCQYEKCTDEELLTRLRSGEEEISDYLMEKYKGFVRQKARAMFLIGGETDDLIQEGMIGLFKAVQSYQPDKDASFRTFAGMCIAASAVDVMLFLGQFLLYHFHDR